ncbi:hypothetical protein LTR86_010184 [Recurvomyces mirabilis]|nr:hypothetical protein LTR86_010184 [Recurvomyces mirabilis]
MAHEANYLVFDILGDLCLGKSFDMKEPGSGIKKIPDLMGSFLQLMHPIAYSPMAEWWLWMKPRGLDWLLTFAVPEDLKKWQMFVKNNLDERTKVEQQLVKSGKGEGAARKDFFHYLFDAKDPATGKSRYELNELYAECEVLTIAGSDTIAIVTAAMTFYLGRDPRIQDKLATEIRRVFSSYDEIASGAKLQSCKYSKAVITETLRMAPPVPADLAREVMRGGSTIEGHFFPEDTKVSTCLYSLSYNPDVYEMPFVFRPERWLTHQEDLDGDPAEKVALADSGFCAFSTGNRGCVGMNMAWMEMKIVLAKLIYAFELRQDAADSVSGGSPSKPLGYQDPRVYQLFDAFVAMRDGPMVEFKLRA